MKKLILLTLLFSLSTTWSQTLKISGKVTDENLNPISGVKVILKEFSTSELTDKTGSFQFDVNNGIYTLIVSKSNFQTQNILIKVKKDVYLNIQLQPKTEQLDEVVINAIKATPDMPVAQTNVKKNDIEAQNLGQDVPFLLESLPSIVVTSDAGTGIGYTGIRIRGISTQQINVTLNGIPFNDPESQSVYWVDIPNIAANTQSIQIQRGVGTSTFGTGAFGASINLETDSSNPKAFAAIQTTAGSFNTLKYGVQGGTGLLNNHFSFSGHYSKTTSDGYIDRASADLKSYYVSGTYQDNNNTLKAIAFGGHEITYQAWYGVDKETFDTNPTFNYAGAIYDNNWNITGFYDNQVDNYQQDHYQLHFNHRFNDRVSFNVATHYTYGRGYYEQYKQDQNFSDYGLTPIVINGQTIDHTDLIRRKWLDNDFYGAIASFDYRSDIGHYIIGLSANEYDGRHFGRIIWAQYASDAQIRQEYYRNTGIKKAINGFAKSVYKISPQLKLFTDIQFRRLDYNVNGTVDWQTPWKLEDQLFFINPKIGLYYSLNQQNQFYFSIAQTNREPNRDDYQNATNGLPKPETLNDIEAGWKYKQSNFKAEANLYGMFYKDQLVLTGQITSVGDPIRENVGKSYRIGIELQTGFRPNKYWSLQGNLTLSDNRNDEYVAKENGQFVTYNNTQIAYSPAIVGAAILTSEPLNNLKIEAITKYVGEQYMDNRNIAASKLPAYWVENILIAYHLKSQWFKNASLNLKLNNIFDQKYASNGYMWGDTPYYFPQAGFNMLAGLNVKF